MGNRERKLNTYSIYYRERYSTRQEMSRNNTNHNIEIRQLTTKHDADSINHKKNLTKSNIKFSIFSPVRSIIKSENTREVRTLMFMEEDLHLQHVTVPPMSNCNLTHSLVERWKWGLWETHLSSVPAAVFPSVLVDRKQRAPRLVPTVTLSPATGPFKSWVTHTCHGNMVIQPPALNHGTLCMAQAQMYQSEKVN